MRHLENDLTGQRYGRLIVIERAPNQGHKVRWRCQCDCGNTAVVQSNNLVQGLTLSCGCYHAEKSREVMNLINKGVDVHKTDALNPKQPSPYMELKGKFYFMWEVLDRDETYSISDDPHWICQCECGVIKSVAQSDLVSERSKNCGCRKGTIPRYSLRSMIGHTYRMWRVIGAGSMPEKFLCKCTLCGAEKEMRLNSILSDTSMCRCINGRIREVDGLSSDQIDRLYRIWYLMKERCTNPDSVAFKNYGGRGIKICDDWMAGCRSFLEWASISGYSDDLSIDRIDNDGPYAPWNCRWATPKQQANNTRKTLRICLNGEVHSPTEWEDITGISADTIRYRFHKGLSAEQVLKEYVNSLDERN